MSDPNGLRAKLLAQYPELLDPQNHPRFTGVPSFFRAPMALSAEGIDIAVVGVPYDGGVTNRTGARLGPREVRVQSTIMRGYNQATGAAPFETAKVADLGDAWPVNPFELVSAHAEITSFFDDIVDAGATTLAVGGDHSVSLPILRSVARKGPVAFIQFDAHCDTGGNYQGSKYHHGSPFSAAVDEGLIDPKKSIQIGIRGGTIVPDLWKFSYDHGMRVVMIDELMERGVKEVMAEARQIVGDTPVYVTFDIDVLDPAFAPGTGTPEIGGITSYQAQQLVRALRGLNVIGADLVEISPPFDPAGSTGLIGATILFELLCVLVEARVARKGRAR
jgi:guanidinopropionase